MKLITRSWVAGTKNGSGTADGATWNSYDGVNNWPSPGVGYDSRYLIKVPEPALGGAGSLSTSPAAALGWMSGVYPNYGVWLDPNGTAKDYYFCRATTTKSSLRPMFAASYLLPCGATAPPT